MRNKNSSYPIFLIIYLMFSCIAVMVFRYIAPPAPPPLPVYAVSWRLINGVLSICFLFPALVLAGLVIPFGWVRPWTEKSEPFPRFSPQFFQHVKTPLFTAFAAVTVYAVIFFLVSPLSQNKKETMTLNSELFLQSKNAAIKQAFEEQWLDAEKSIAVCKRIWPQSVQEGGEIAALAGRIEVNASQARLNIRDFSAEAFYTEKNEKVGGNTRKYRERDPITAFQALSSAETALNEKRYLDAYWLAHLTFRLGKTGTDEYEKARRIAAQAWDNIKNMEPSEKELEAFAVFRQKREGYEALNDGDWLRAYHIFADLFTKAPEDPDVRNFFIWSRQEAEYLAFFVKKQDITLGVMSRNAIFSLPLVDGVEKGRAVLRVANLSRFSAAIYGVNAELAVFDQRNNLLYQTSSRFCKILPQEIDGKSQVLVMFRSIDSETHNQYDPLVTRVTERKRYEKKNLFAMLDNTQILFDINYQDFVLLTNIQQGLDSLLLQDLIRAGKKFGEYGYIAPVFQAEILYRAFSLVMFLPIAVWVIAIGWRSRARQTPFFTGIPMLFILPLIFAGLVFLYQKLINSLCIWTILTLGFTVSAIIFAVGTIGLLLIMLVFLAGQKETGK